MSYSHPHQSCQLFKLIINTFKTQTDGISSLADCTLLSAFCRVVCLMFMFQSTKIINIDIVHKLHFLMWPPPPLVILIKLLAQQFCAEQL